MNASEIQILIGSTTGLLVALAAGAKWLLTHIDAKQARAELAEANARAELSARLLEEIRVLRTKVDQMEAEKRIFWRRIYQLESLIYSTPGIEIPAMEGWPPV